MEALPNIYRVQPKYTTRNQGYIKLCPLGPGEWIRMEAFPQLLLIEAQKKSFVPASEPTSEPASAPNESLRYKLDVTGVVNFVEAAFEGTTNPGSWVTQTITLKNNRWNANGSVTFKLPDLNEALSSEAVREVTIQSFDYLQKLRANAGLECLERYCKWLKRVMKIPDERKTPKSQTPKHSKHAPTSSPPGHVRKAPKQEVREWINANFKISHDDTRRFQPIPQLAKPVLQRSDSTSTSDEPETPVQKSVYEEYRDLFTIGNNMPSESKTAHQPSKTTDQGSGSASTFGAPKYVQSTAQQEDDDGKPSRIEIIKKIFWPQIPQEQKNAENVRQYLELVDYLWSKYQLLRYYARRESVEEEAETAWNLRRRNKRTTKEANLAIAWKGLFKNAQKNRQGTLGAKEEEEEEEDYESYFGTADVIMEDVDGF